MNFLELARHADELLQAKNFSGDYCVNGIQLSTDRSIRKIVSGVTASMVLINKAIELNADAIVVHHGLFWFSDPLTITGTTKQRVAALLKNDIGVLAYHLPLDAHHILGNNAQLARLMGWNWVGQTFGRHQLGFIGSVDSVDISTFSDQIEDKLNRKTLVLSSSNKPITKVAWVTGAGQSYFKEAVSIGVDVFVTGEASEFVYHLAMETGVAYIAAGHHATERYGVQALCESFSETFGLSHCYFDIDNPV